jgi:hypothetical protein
MTLQSLYVFFRIPLEFWGLNGYYICVLWILKKNYWIFRKQNLCSTSTLIHIKMFNEPKITTKNGILVSLSFVAIFFPNYRRHFIVLG